MSVMQLAIAFTAGFLPFFFGASGLGKARISLSEFEVLSPQFEEDTVGNGWLEPDVHVRGSSVGSVRLLSRIHCT